MHSGLPHKLKTHSKKEKTERPTANEQQHENNTKIQIENLIMWIRRTLR